MVEGLENANHVPAAFVALIVKAGALFGMFVRTWVPRVGTRWRRALSLSAHARRTQYVVPMFQFGSRAVDGAQGPTSRNTTTLNA